MIDHRLTDYDPRCLKADDQVIAEKFDDGREFLYLETYALVRDGQRSRLVPFGLRPVEFTRSCDRLKQCCIAANRALFEKGRDRTKAILETYKKAR